MGRTRVFVSHSYSDRALAARFVEAMEAAIHFDSKEICCTSLPGYALPLGKKVSTQLRKQIQLAVVVVGLLTPKSLQSSYVLFELGAAWGMGEKTIPILAKGVRPDRLPDLVKELTPGRLSTSARVEEVMKELSSVLEREMKPTNTPVYREAVRELVKEAKPPKRETPK